MTTTMDDLAKKFEGLELMMQQTLDKVSGIDAWLSSAEESLGTLLAKSQETASWLHHLETAPPQPPVRPPPPPLPPSSWVDPFDLNPAPPQPSRPYAAGSERPSEHRMDVNHRDVGGGGSLDLVRHAQS